MRAIVLAKSAITVAGIPAEAVANFGNLLRRYVNSIAVLTRLYLHAGSIKEMRIAEAQRRELRPIFLSRFQVTKRNTS